MSCDVSLQDQINATEAGSIVNAPACIYRETITIPKPLTLIGDSGAEIRGSDVWSNWGYNGTYWVSNASMPGGGARGNCATGNDTCGWHDQVIMDGQLLAQVGATPTHGHWAADSGLHVLLADDPSGRTVEVTQRSRWVTVGADNVTIRGFTMRYANNDAQTGAIYSLNNSNLTVQLNDLAYAHGADLIIQYGSGHKVMDNAIHDAGQIGFTSYRSSNLLVANNAIFHNNLAGYETLWEAGGLKLVGVVGAVLDTNNVHDNVGPGLWCDIQCENITFSNNSIHDNSGMGIEFEISRGADIYGNLLWNNAPAPGGGGMDVFVSTSANANVHNNTVGQTLGSIIVRADNRPDAPSGGTGGNSVHDNVVGASP